MFKQSLTPKTTALICSGLLALCLLIGFGVHIQQGRSADSREAKMEWQRDRETGVPDTGLGENATPEEREEARHRAQEEKMTQERAANP